MTQSAPQYTRRRLPQTVAAQLRPRTVWDVALSIVLLVLANASFLIGALFATFSIAFIALVGSVLTIVFLVRRRRAWWVALGTLLLVVVGWIVGFLVFASALHY
jgi:uncharacterized membrane protein HdeD (DUF308 family)